MGRETGREEAGGEGGGEGEGVVGRARAGWGKQEMGDNAHRYTNLCLYTLNTNI